MYDDKGQRHDIDADTVVLGIGLRTRGELAERFKGLAPEVYLIGSPFEVPSIYNAFENVWRAVLQT